ncbi:hypothetical protein [Spiroplasma endosymbiont of Panorpa germanica]|uniref:hypothetical protein n=1 Tax=Spiroplasma endosymbiont of Panorpa germanica TaxID=3066314 RepID=UPI0030CAA1F6
MKVSNKKYKNFSIVFSPVGQLFTKKFLKNKNVKIQSEGDFVSRVQICTTIFYSLIITSLLIMLLSYFKVSIALELSKVEQLTERQIFLLKDQKKLIDFSILLIGLNIIFLTTMLIFFTNISLGNSIRYLTYIFNIIFIAQLLFFCNFVFVLDIFGLFSKTSSIDIWLKFITKWWLWIVVVSLCLTTFGVHTKLFVFINLINREWTRIKMIRKNSNRENSFIFKFWVHPNENRARKLMIVAGALSMSFASIIHFASLVFQNIDLDFMKYFSLFFGCIIILIAFIIPYNKFSVYYFGAAFLIYSGITIYALVMIQNTAFLPGQWIIYIYFFCIIVWSIILSSNINIFISILNKINVYAIVVNQFDGVEQFKETVDTIYKESHGK